jgi:hypothetical protein
VEIAQTAADIARARPEIDASPDNQHRAGRVMGDLVRHRAQQKALGAGHPLVADHDQAGLALLGDVETERGHGVLLAHPERCPAFHRDPRMLGSLVRAGMLTSITAGPLVGRFGGEVRRFALELAQSGMVHNVASDAHDGVKRPPGRDGGPGVVTMYSVDQPPCIPSISRG